MPSDTGSISLAEEAMRLMLADCPAFRSWCGETTSGAAGERIYVDALPVPTDGKEHTLAELQTLRPCVVLWTSEEDGFAKSWVGSGEYRDEGSLEVRFLQDVDPVLGTDEAAISRAFKNAIGLIIDELCARSATAGFVNFSRIALKRGPYRSHPDEHDSQGNIIGADLRITWGAAA